MGSSLSIVRRFLLWDFPRAGWQYDVIVGVILLFTFLTPREWFRDQPRASNVVMLPAQHSLGPVFWLEPEALGAVPEGKRPAEAERVLKTRTQKAYHVVRLDPIFDSEDEIKGFMAYTQL